MKSDFTKRIARLSGVFMAVLMCGQLCHAQEGNATVPTLKLSARLVVLDVVVTDKDGHTRSDLKLDDFKISESGAPQAIVSFEPPSQHLKLSGAPILSTADLQARAPDTPVTIIVLDEINTRFEDIAFARSSLKKYLKAQPVPLVAPTMLVAASLDHFQLLQDYTQNSDSILRALDHHLTAYPWHLRNGDSAIEQIAISLSALERIAQSAAGHPGRKTIVWVGKGSPGIDMNSPTLTSDAQQAISSVVQQAVNILRDTRVTLYTIDPSALSPQIPGLDLNVDPAESIGEAEMAKGPFSDGFQFGALALATGGRMFSGRNDVDKELAEGARDAANYYTLAYRPTNQSDATQAYRDIHVQVTNPNLSVDYRKGYFSSGATAPMAFPTANNEAMNAAGESTLIYTGLNVMASPNPSLAGSYVINVPERQLVWSPSSAGNTADLRLIVAAVDAKGRVLRRSAFEVVAKRDSAGGADSTGPRMARIEASVQPVADTVRLRFVVRSNSDGRIGTADLKLDGAPHK